MESRITRRGRSNVIRFGSEIRGLFLVVLLVGCATSPPEPPLLSGNPELNGLVLLDCSMSKKWQDLLHDHAVSIWPTHCALGKVGEPAVVIPGDCWSGQLIFTGLEPGEYYLKLVEGVPLENTGVPLYRYVIREGILRELVFTLAAGEVLYLGAIWITEGHETKSQNQPHTWTFNQQKGTDTLEFSRILENEEMAWTIFLETYGDSPWGQLISELPGM